MNNITVENIENIIDVTDVNNPISIAETAVNVEVDNVDNIIVNTSNVVEVINAPIQNIIDVTKTVVNVIIGGGGSSGGTVKPYIVVPVTAGQAISALKLIYIDPATGLGFYADNNIIGTIKSLLGVSLTAANMDAIVMVVTEGEMTDINWAWDMSADVSLFLGTNGAIIQGAPLSSVATARIGFALSATTIMVKFGEPIIN